MCKSAFHLHSLWAYDNVSADYAGLIQIRYCESALLCNIVPTGPENQYVGGFCDQVEFPCYDPNALCDLSTCRCKPGFKTTSNYTCGKYLLDVNYFMCQSLSTRAHLHVVGMLRFMSMA